MDCNACQPLFAEFALGQLPEDKRRRVAAHLATGCPHCARALRETEEAWVLLVDTLPPAVVPERIEAALRQRHAQEVFTNQRDDMPPSPGRQSFPLRWAIAATLLLAATIGLVAWYSSVHRGNEPDQVALPPEQMQQLRFEFEQFSREVNSSRLRLASLHERDRQSAIHGYVVWDRWARQVHFYAFGLPPLGEGRVYRIWLLRDGAAPRPAGTLEPKPNGTASILVDVPAAVAEPFQVAVTEQDAEAPLDSAVPPWLTSEVE
jgi:anti-sigma-K factor RskA